MNCKCKCKGRTLTAVTANRVCGRPQFKTIGGKDFVVVPMVMMACKNGALTMAGSQGPLLYPEDEIAKSVKAWHNVPVLVGHPRDDITNDQLPASAPGVAQRQQIGVVGGPSFKDGKLTATALIDVNRAKRIAPRLYGAMVSGQKISVSTGLHTINHPVEGEHEGRPYHAVATDYRPDHLAVLEVPGACSIEDGCGLNQNQQLARNIARNKRRTCSMTENQRRQLFIAPLPMMYSSDRMADLPARLRPGGDELEIGDIYNSYNMNRRRQEAEDDDDDEEDDEEEEYNGRMCPACGSELGPELDEEDKHPGVRERNAKAEGSNADVVGDFGAIQEGGAGVAAEYPARGRNRRSRNVRRNRRARNDAYEYFDADTSADPLGDEDQEVGQGDRPPDPGKLARLRR